MRSIRSRLLTVASAPNFSRGRGEEVFPRIAIKLCWLCQRLWMPGKRALPPNTMSIRVNAMILPITASHPGLLG